MKKLLIATVIFILPLLTHAVFAQRGGSPEERAERQTAMMKGELGLTDEQVSKVEEINLKFAKSNEELMAKHKGNREAMRAAFRESRKLREEALAQVLTEEQMTKLREKKEEMRSKRSKRGGRLRN